jgi:Uma2 family endonuclease
MEQEVRMHSPAQEERVLTIAEFERLPEEDAYRIELVRGRLVRSPRPAPLHGVLTARLAHLLYEFVERRGRGVVLADVGVVLARDPDTVRGPDLAFYSLERIPDTGYGSGFWGPPDLAVEITSPSNRASEMGEKLAEYLEAGVRLVWVVDPPARSVSIHEPGGSGRVLGDDAVLEGDIVRPGFRLPLASFFSL